MIAYKGFEKGLVCLGYQFHMGLNVTEEANCAQNGFHCAENPLDCLTYYSDMNRSEYYLVDAGGDVDEDDRDSKIACTKLTVIKKLEPCEFFAHAPDSSKITQIAIVRVDGKRIKSGVWYDTNLTERKVA